MNRFISLSIIAFFLLVLAPFTLAATSAEPAEVSVGIYVLHVGKFEVATGSYTVDFYLSMKCDSQCPAFDFEFMNGRATSVDKILDYSAEKFYRIQAQLVSPVDLKSYPFDTQQLELILEDKELTTNDLVYVVNEEETALDPSVSIPGWVMTNSGASVREHTYDIYNESYSQYVFTIDLARIKLNSFIKTFLPIAFIMLVMLSSFVLDPDKLSTRMGMVGSALVASVMFHVSLTNQIPPVGYLTLADKFMILTYFILLMSFVLNVILMELTERQQKAKVEKFHRLTEYWMIAVVIILYLFFFFIVL